MIPASSPPPGTVEWALAYVAEFKGDGRCSLNCLYSELLAAEVLRLRDEVASLHEAAERENAAVERALGRAQDAGHEDGYRQGYRDGRNE